MKDEELRACPCLYLENPCYGGNCTCVNPISSAGCENCCTYGNLEQRKRKALMLDTTRREARKKSLEELTRIWEEDYNNMNNDVNNDYSRGIDPHNLS